MWAREITKWILNDYTADILLKMNQSCKCINPFTVFDSEKWAQQWALSDTELATHTRRIVGYHVAKEASVLPSKAEQTEVS